MLKEFREFVARGNVLDLAVAVIMGAAFGKIVSTLVDNVIMPPVGLLLGRVDFANLFIDLSRQNPASLAEAKEKGLPVIAYGALINDIISFLIIAAVVFAIVKAANRFKREEEVDTKDCPFCLTEIPLGATRCAACCAELGAARA